MNVSKCITPAEAARRIGVDRAYVRRLILGRKLKSVRTECGATLVPVSDVRRFIKERNQ